MLFLGKIICLPIFTRLVDVLHQFAKTIDTLLIMFSHFAVKILMPLEFMLEEISMSQILFCLTQ